MRNFLRIKLELCQNVVNKAIIRKAISAILRFNNLVSLFSSR